MFQFLPVPGGLQQGAVDGGRRQFRATVAISPPSAGTVTPASGSFFDHGSKITLTEIPAPAPAKSASGTLQSKSPAMPLRIHAGDAGFSGGATATIDTSIANTSSPELYQSERTSTDSFQCNGTLANGDYSVTLRFAGLHYSSAGNRSEQDPEPGPFAPPDRRFSR